MGSEDETYKGVYFSPSVIAMYPEAWKYDGTYNEDTWPADAILLNDEEVSAYWKQSAPTGKRIGVADGRPVWVDLPPLTHSELVSQADSQKNSLMTEATNAIAPLEDAVDLDMATDDEKAQLTAWKKFRVLLNRVDTSSAPNIDWPTPPA